MTQTYVGFKCYWLIHGAFPTKNADAKYPGDC